MASDPEQAMTPEQKKLSSISNTLMIVLVMVGCLLGSTCSTLTSIRSNVSTIRYRTGPIQSDLNQIKGRLDNIERVLKDRP